MARLSIKQIREKVSLVNKLTGRPIEYATQLPNGRLDIHIGHLSVDYNTTYGGCQLNETTNKAGGVTDRVFNLSWGHRMKLGEMSAFLDGLIAGCEACKGGDHV